MQKEVDTLRNTLDQRDSSGSVDAQSLYLRKLNVEKQNREISLELEDKTKQIEEFTRINTILTSNNDKLKKEVNYLEEQV